VRLRARSARRGRHGHRDQRRSSGAARRPSRSTFEAPVASMTTWATSRAIFARLPGIAGSRIATTWCSNRADIAARVTGHPAAVARRSAARRARRFRSPRPSRAPAWSDRSAARSRRSRRARRDDRRDRRLVRDPMDAMFRAPGATARGAGSAYRSPRSFAAHVGEGRAPAPAARTRRGSGACCRPNSIASGRRADPTRSDHGRARPARAWRGAPAPSWTRRRGRPGGRFDRVTRMLARRRVHASR